MTPQTIAIVGENGDFCAVLAEHAERELGVKVVRGATAEAALVIEQAEFAAQKPVRLQDVLSTIDQRLKREGHTIGDAVFSVQQKNLLRGEKAVALTDKETQLLLALVKNKHGVEKDALLKDVWGVTSELESHTLETHIYRLRAKLKDAGVAATISALPGKYMIEYER